MPICADTFRPASFTNLNWKMIEPSTDGVIYWHIVNFTPDQPQHKTLYAFTKAFEIWQEAFDKVPPVGRYITLKPTSDFHKAHVRLFFMDPHKKKQRYTISDGSTYDLRNDWPFNGPQGVLAHRPPNKHEVHFDESEKWSDIHKFEKVGKKWVLFVNLMAVVLHEVGHVWDIGHSDVKSALMAPVYDGNRITITPDDFKALSHKWHPIKTRIAANAPAPVSRPSNDLLATALRFYGLKEVAGNGSNPTILKWIKKYIPIADDDSKFAWCAIAMNEVCKLAGYEHTNSAMAKSFLKIGEVIEWKDRQPGDLVILNRTNDPLFGHVTIYVNDRTYAGRPGFRGLGGNQQDAWNIRTFPDSRIAGFRRLKKVA